MTKELIERLRDTASKGVSVWGDLQMEAAKEIEILTAEREAYASAMDRMKAELAAIKAREPVAWRWRMNGQWHYGPEPLFKDGFTTQEPLYDKPIPPVREPLSDNTIAALRQAIVQPARQVPTTNYVQPVPDHCDRITWRNRYYHLPLAAELSAARAQEPLTEATKASCALGYEECSHRCGTPHVCCDHYVEPEPIIEALQARVAELEKVVTTLKGDLTQRTADLMLITAELVAIKDQEPVATLWRENNQKLYPGLLIDLTATGEALPTGVLHHLFAAPTTPVREPLTDAQINEIRLVHGVTSSGRGIREVAQVISFARAIEAAIAQPATTEWTVIAPDGTRFTGPTPLKAALPASKYRLEIDPVAAVKFMEIIDQEAEKGRQEAEQCMRDYGTLDCPACGGSGHIGDVKQPAQVPAGSIRLWDAQWVSIVNHDNAYNGWSTNDAVNHAVRMTERYIAANVAQNNLPPLPAAPEVK